MFCQNCGKNTPDNEVKIVNGKTLCSECAREITPEVTNGFSSGSDKLKKIRPLNTNGNIPSGTNGFPPNNNVNGSIPSKESKISLLFKQAGDKMRGFKDKLIQLVNRIGKKKMIIILSSALAVVIAIIVLLILGLKFHIFCRHDWQAETCSSPKICAKCGKTEGEKLEHEWTDADCENPETCLLCGDTKGQALGHKWKDATCENPKTCSVCGKTEGKKLDHNWSKATCDEPKTCARCGKTDGKKLEHQWKKASCDKPKTCILCGETTGKADGHKWKDATCEKPKTCSVCGKTEGKKSDHKWTEATIVSPKKCSVCGKTEGSALDYNYIGTGKVTTDSGSLFIRKNPDKNSDKVSSVPQYELVNVYNCNNSNWYYVEYNGKYGYSSSEFITLVTRNTSYSNYSSGNNSSNPNFTIEQVVALLKNPRDFGIDAKIEGDYDVSVQSYNGTEFIQFIEYDEGGYDRTATTIQGIKQLENVVQSLKDKGLDPDRETTDLLTKYKQIKDERLQINIEMADNIQGMVDAVSTNYKVVYCVVDPSREYVWSDDPDKANYEGLIFQIVNGEVLWNLYDIFENQ